MALLFFALLVCKLLFDGMMVFRAEVIVATNNPRRRYREIVAQKNVEV